jgi:2-amino-4-hydroxy-6-hydroxymethyldihydropteridine diphosphokinase
MSEAQLHQVVLSVGTNAQREVNLAYAFDALADHFGELVFSSVYESQPVDDVVSANYYNAVVCIFTEKTVADVQRIAHEIEALCGRDRMKSDVDMDIDLLLYDDTVGVVDGVNLPHDDIARCAYVLRPLADCLPDALHPTLGHSFGEMWELFCNEGSEQVLEPIDFVWRDQLVSVIPPCLAI